MIINLFYFNCLLVVSVNCCQVFLPACSPAPPIHQPLPPHSPAAPINQPLLPHSPAAPIHQPLPPHNPAPPISQPLPPHSPAPPIHQPLPPHSPAPPIHHPLPQYKSVAHPWKHLCQQQERQGTGWKKSFFPVANQSPHFSNGKAQHHPRQHQNPRGSSLP